jgi:DNA-binding NarL/FixJ family response regulator
MSIRILIADDHGIVREGLQLLIEQEDDMEVVDEAAEGREAIEFVRQLKPNVVLMDVSMPGLNGIEATRQIVKENPDTRVLALSAHSNKRFVTDMLKAGASGYILKENLAGELVRAIHAAMAGQRYLCPKVAAIVVDDYLRVGKSESKSPLLDKLTGKERELLQLLVENKTNKEAARLLYVSVKTVDARRRELMNKLGISGIAELTKFAIREGLTSVDF